MSTETIEAIKAQVLDLKDERASFLKRRLEIDSELSSINTEIRSNRNLPRDLFVRYLGRQDELKREINGISSRLHELKQKITRLSEMEFQLKQQAAAAPQDEGRNARIRVSLRELHKKYSEFAADATRVASMRRMASEFCIDLQAALRAEE